MVHCIAEQQLPDRLADESAVIFLVDRAGAAALGCGRVTTAADHLARASHLSSESEHCVRFTTA